MNKAKLLAGSAATAFVAVASVSPAFAQASGPFADVPTDHWAYQSVDKLQKGGIVIGYPDGTYGGKRAMTRYEFAVAIARLLEKIPQPDLTNYYTKAETDAAIQAATAGFATKEEVQALRNLVNEFQTELTTLGVDLEAVKKRLTALEGRVTALEDEVKRVKVYGTVSLNGRATNTRTNSVNFRDQDGFIIQRGSTTPGNQLVGNGNLLGATRILHDIDLGVKARLSDTATADVLLNFGNYLSFLGGVGSYANFPNGRTASTGGGFGNQDQTQTVYKAVIEAPFRLPGIGGVTATVGRVPLQFTPYTLKLIDVDQYFYNDKTDLGNIPIDGGKLAFNIGPLGITGIAGKTDPIRFLSNIASNLTGDNSAGLFAGASRGAYSGINGTGGFSTSGRPSGNRLQNNGGILVEQLAGARVVFGTSKFGTIGGTYLALAGQRPGSIPGTSTLNPLAFGVNPANPSTFGEGSSFDRANINRVYVYGADVNASIGSIGINASYTKSDTAGSRITGISALNDGTFVTSFDQETTSKINDDNEAYEAGASYSIGALSLGAGYRYVGPYFAAPGSWSRVGTLTNPVDIEGGYGRIGYAIARGLSLNAEAQFYNGTGEAVNDGGLSEDDRINNYRGGLKFGLTSASNVDLGVDYTEYKIGVGAFAGSKPREIFYNIGYGYSFSPNSSFKLLYQIVDFDDKNTGFDPSGAGKGGVAAAQFQVKF
ncbi:MAG: S-layer homology domain-containing protein [Cytophagales bacterium]|nr:S-layer homology domain-containing protein [Armatimonadota bacterium]